MARNSWFTVCYIDTNGTECTSRTWSTLAMARKALKRHIGYGLAARIMKGGPGGIEVA